MARVAPLNPPYTPDIQAAFDAIMPAGVDPLVLFRTLAVNARVYERFRAGGLLDRGLLTLRQREIVIDRTCALNATVQQQLYASGIVGPLEMLPYLERLGAALAATMIRDARPITLKVVGVGGSLSARQAESVGLIATELVMNALKHAFPDQNMKGRINVAYDVDGTNWKLSVADNGIGKPDGVFAQTKTGLGTGIIKALAQKSQRQS